MNYQNLSDIEFESLCQDVMSVKLGKPLERFGSGRDGGIDLTDNCHTKQIVIQVKHYVKTDTAGLIRTLEKEVDKVRRLAPKEYYLCCSKDLTPDSKDKIFSMFSKYMSTPSSIITSIELDDFLSDPVNCNILRKHYKLWIESTNMLTSFFANNVFIDSEVLLWDVKNDIKQFVKTTAFTAAIDCLSKKNILLIVGNPGVGKSITSKMIVLNYAAQGYQVRYSTNGSDYTSIKKAISASRDTKEIILLDDCFGQSYFRMKEFGEQELLSLIKYVNLNPNKVLLLNSRVSIYNEARKRSIDLVKSFDKKEFKAYILDMDTLSIEDKGMILYNHLYFSALPQEYFDNVKTNKNYRKIVLHDNYSPRIVEFVCLPSQRKNISPSGFTTFVIHCLDYPDQIWRNEFEDRLQVADRSLLTTLYSLTETVAPYELVMRCYEKRLCRMSGVDTSINQFENATNRLNGSMIKICDAQGIKMLGVANPSVNDFLKAYLEENSVEKAKLIECSICIWQYKRLLTEQEYKEHMLVALSDHSILDYQYASEYDRCGIITYYCAKFSVYDKAYCSYIHNYFMHMSMIEIEQGKKVFPFNVINGLLERETITFYSLDRILMDPVFLAKELGIFQLDELIQVITKIEWMYHDDFRSCYTDIIRNILRESVELYCCEVPFDSYNIDISREISEYHWYDKNGYECFDDNSLVDSLESTVQEYVLNELIEFMASLPADIALDTGELSHISITVQGVREAVDDYMQNNLSMERFNPSVNSAIHQYRVLDQIFER